MTQSDALPDLAPRFPRTGGDLCGSEHQRMSGIDIATSLLRGVHIAALVSLFGTLLFTTAVLPAGSDTAPMRSLLRSITLSVRWPA